MHAMVTARALMPTSVHTPHVLAQGRIACCNVVSDLYAMGVTEIDTMLMLLTVRRVAWATT